MTQRDATPYAQMGATDPAAVRGGAARRRMMRQPTPKAEIYLWHWQFMRGLEPAPHEIEPQAGWYKKRLVRGGPFVPVEIWLDQSIDPETGELTAPEILRCTVNGFEKDPLDVWTRCTPISQADFEAMKAAQMSAGYLDPNKKVNLMMKVTGPHG